LLKCLADLLGESHGFGDAGATGGGFLFCAGLGDLALGFGQSRHALTDRLQRAGHGLFDILSGLSGLSELLLPELS